MHMSLVDIDNTSIDSLYGLLGYLTRLSASKDKDILTVGRRKYRRVTADEIHF